MSEHPYSQGLRGLDLTRLSLHSRGPPQQGFGDKPAPGPGADGHQPRKHFPEKLHFNPASLRLRSRTESTRSSVSSAHAPNSATTYSASTLASPLSSSYASDLQERLAAHSLDGPTRPSSRIRHRQQPSSATTCSTYINDDYEVPLDEGYPDYGPKIQELLNNCPEPGAARRRPSASRPTETFVKEEEHISPGSPREWSRSQFSCDSPVPKSDTKSVASDDLSPDDADAVLNYTLQLVYGIELRETSAPEAALRQLVSSFVNGLEQHVWQAPSEAPAAQNESTSSSSTTTPSQGAGSDGAQGYGKRKKQAGGNGGEELSDGEASGFGPAKRPKPSPRDDENMRLSCPFRKRNPHRFNVRDHHSCAMTYFPKFAELRQHIVKQHKRDDPSAFVCDRCTRDFRTRRELRDHQRQPKERMCDISDHDPESGIDGPTAIKLVSRKRVSGMSAEVQWREVWNILFPDDDDQMIQPYHFTPVIEHFELSAQYLASFQYLQASLRNKISNPATLETLATKFQQCFIEAVESCADMARSMPYSNRSNKRNEPARTQTAQPPPMPRKPRAMASRPDSGVVMDDGSEEGSSMLESSGLSGHRDSVQTVRSLAPRGGSSLAPTALRELLPAPAPPIIDEAFSGPLSSLPLGITPGGVDSAAAVQAWNNGVPFGTDDLGLGMLAQWMPPQPGFTAMDESLFYAADLSTMDSSFAGYSGR